MNAKGGKPVLVYGDAASTGGYALGYLAYAAEGALQPAVLFVWDGDKDRGRLVGMTCTPRGKA